MSRRKILAMRVERYRIVLYSNPSHIIVFLPPHLEFVAAPLHLPVVPVQGDVEDLGEEAEAHDEEDFDKEHHLLPHGGGGDGGAWIDGLPLARVHGRRARALSDGRLVLCRLGQRQSQVRQPK